MGELSCHLPFEMGFAGLFFPLFEGLWDLCSRVEGGGINDGTSESLCHSMLEGFNSSLVVQGDISFVCKLFKLGEKVIKTFSLLEFAQLLVGFRSIVLIEENIFESFKEVFPEDFICLLGSFLMFFAEFLELFLLPGIYASAVHIAEHGNNPREGVLHNVVVSVDFLP